MGLVEGIPLEAMQEIRIKYQWEAIVAEKNEIKKSTKIKNLKKIHHLIYKY